MMTYGGLLSEGEGMKDNRKIVHWRFKLLDFLNNQGIYFGSRVDNYETV